MRWYEQYISKPWAGIPDPPNSFSCGVFVTWIYKHHLGIDMPEVWCDSSKLRDAIRNMQQVGLYGFEPVEPPYQPFDLCLMQRSVRYDHAALLIKEPTGLLFLHCADNMGVVLESEFELKATTGCSHMTFFRHKDITPELISCHA